MTFRTIEISDPQFEIGGLRYLTVKSPALKGRVDVSVFIPEEAKGQANVPVIVLLHGVYGSHWAWTMSGGAHLTLQKMIATGSIQPFILVMPSDGLWGDGSGYVPHASQNFEAWIGRELPILIRQQFVEVSAASSFYIGGLSMGGYGAFRIGVKYVETYRGISGHSSVTSIQNLMTFVEEDWSFWNAEQADDIGALLLQNREQAPPFRFDCGLEDDLLSANRALHQLLLDHAIKHVYEEFPGGHEWSYWQEHVRETFRFFDTIEQKAKAFAR